MNINLNPVVAQSLYQPTVPSNVTEQLPEDFELTPSQEPKVEYAKDQIIEHKKNEVTDYIDEQQDQFRQLTTGKIALDHANEMADSYVDMIAGEPSENDTNGNNTSDSIYRDLAEYTQNQTKVGIYQHSGLDQLGNLQYEQQANLAKRFMTIQPVPEHNQIDYTV